MTKAERYIARPEKSVIEGIPEFKIYHVNGELSDYLKTNDEGIEEIEGSYVSKITIVRVHGRHRDRTHYHIVRKTLPSNTIVEILDTLPNTRRTSLTILQSLVVSNTIDELDRLNSKLEESFNVEEYLNNLGLNTRSREIYPGMENILLKQLEENPQYTSSVQEYKQRSKIRRAQLIGSSLEE